VAGSPMMHDFSLTDKYVVLYDLPVTFDPVQVMPASVPRWLQLPARLAIQSLIGRVRIPGPIAAMASTLAIAIVSEVLVAVPQLHALAPWLFSHYWLSFGDFLRDRQRLAGVQAVRGLLGRQVRERLRAVEQRAAGLARA